MFQRTLFAVRMCSPNIVSRNSIRFLTLCRRSVSERASCTMRSRYIFVVHAPTQTWSRYQMNLNNSPSSFNASTFVTVSKWVETNNARVTGTHTKRTLQPTTTKNVFVVSWSTLTQSPSALRILHKHRLNTFIVASGNVLYVRHDGPSVRRAIQINNTNVTTNATEARNKCLKACRIVDWTFVICWLRLIIFSRLTMLRPSAAEPRHMKA